MPCTGLNVTNAAPAKNIMLIILWLFGLQVWIYLPLTWLTSRGFRVVSCLWLPTGWSCRSICGLRWAKWLQTWQPWLEKWWVEVLFLTPTHGPMMLYQNLSIHWASVMKNVFGADGPHTVLCIQCQNCDLFIFCLRQSVMAPLSPGWSTSDLPRRQSDQPRQVSSIHGSDLGSREGPVQVLGHPLPAGEKSGCSDGRAGLEQSWVTGEDPVSSGVILLAQMHTHSLSTHSQHRGRNLANSTECLKLPSTVSKTKF